MNKSEYQTYLASREWALKREAIRDRSQGKCERCWHSRMDAVHHITYERVGHENLADLMAICDPCHEFLSGKADLDPRVFHGKPIELENSDYLAAALLCPFCLHDYLHQLHVEIFSRPLGEDGESECVVVHGASANREAGTYNPSGRRDGLLIYFWCEGCSAGWPPIDQISYDLREEYSKTGYFDKEYHLPLALAIYQHKGRTYIEWRTARPLQP